ncbi:DER1-domain-containing protein [Acaromyces ingoldii]|uniref:Derlin n=1 Tax=Acaromyces ingoldii TaxID=215250 RepID=A0A316YUU4_9BASI|nr:DER1-domain-containing protein [Acaromyces ingoldii]PWN93187.1 DER1-domain-containing protein [Acaromyces ingoldii]
MDELLKIPPVTRTLLGSTLLVTLPVLLQLSNPYHILLWWPAVIRRWQLWRPITAFFFGGKGLPLLFDTFLLFRNSTDLELNTFYRRTSEYAWALMLIGSLILATNYPLGSPVLFSPMLNALTYLWARSNPHAVVSIFGLINCPAPYLPYAYLALDLVRGGPGLAVQSATGLLSAHIYYYLATILPATDGGRGPRWLPGAPAFLQRLLPDSLDPATAHQQPQQGGSVRSTGWGGTAFAPAGRSFGDSSARTPAQQQQQQGRALNSSRSAGGGGSWIPSFLRGASSSASASRPGARASGPDREAMLAAAEARLRSQREQSIAGRNAAASRAAQQASDSPEARARAARTNSGATSAAAAGSVLGEQEQSRTSARPFTSTTPSSRKFSFGKEAAKGSGEDKDEEQQETASGSGGRVAEIRRRGAAPNNENQEGEGKDGQADRGHDWGQGRKLGE